MRVVRTVLIFASGVGVYALMAACGGGSDSASSSPSGNGGDATSSTRTRATASSNGGGGHGGFGGAPGGGSGPNGGSGATSANVSSSSSTATNVSSSSGSGGSGGSFGGLRLLPEYGAASDGARDAQLALTPWLLSNLPNTVYNRPERYFWDSFRQEECVYSIGGDGQRRCLPTDAGGGPVMYADAACTQRAVAVEGPPPGCQIRVPKYATATDMPESSCPGAGWYPTHVYPVGAFLGSNLGCHASQNGHCQATACGIQSPNGYAVYAVGSEVAASKFVSGTLTHD
jgi:hypothetical protein